MPNDPLLKLVQITRITDGSPTAVNPDYVCEISQGYVTIEGKRPQEKRCLWFSTLSGSRVNKTPADGDFATVLEKFSHLRRFTKMDGDPVAISPRFVVEINSGVWTDPDTGDKQPATWIVWTAGDYTRKCPVAETYAEVMASFGMRTE